MSRPATLRVSGIVWIGLTLLLARTLANIVFLQAFLDGLDGSYCTYSAYGETGNCVTDDCADPVYPDPHFGGYKGEL
jgi:hypothetical protein